MKSIIIFNVCREAEGLSHIKNVTFVIYQITLNHHFLRLLSSTLKIIYIKLMNAT